jgi:hypothetical protein
VIYLKTIIVKIKTLCTIRGVKIKRIICMKTEQIRVVQRILNGFFVSTASTDKALQEPAYAIREQLDILAESQTTKDVICLLEIAAEAHLNASHHQSARDVFTVVHAYLWQIFTTEPSAIAEQLIEEKDALQGGLNTTQSDIQKTQRDIETYEQAIKATQARIDTQEKEHDEYIKKGRNKGLSPQSIRPIKNKQSHIEELNLLNEKLSKLISAEKNLQLTLGMLIPPEIPVHNKESRELYENLSQNTLAAFKAIVDEQNTATPNTIISSLNKQAPIDAEAVANSSSSNSSTIVASITEAPKIPVAYIAALQEVLMGYLCDAGVLYEDRDPLDKALGSLTEVYTQETSDNLKQNWESVILVLQLSESNKVKILFPVLQDIMREPNIPVSAPETIQDPQPESKKRKGLFNISLRKKAKTDTIPSVAREDESVAIEAWKQQVKQKINQQTTTPSVSIVQTAALHQNVTLRHKGNKPAVQSSPANL